MEEIENISFVLDVMIISPLLEIERDDVSVVFNIFSVFIIYFTCYNIKFIPMVTQWPVHLFITTVSKIRQKYCCGSLIDNIVYAPVCELNKIGMVSKTKK